MKDVKKNYIIIDNEIHNIKDNIEFDGIYNRHRIDELKLTGTDIDGTYYVSQCDNSIHNVKDCNNQPCNDGGIEILEWDFSNSSYFVIEKVCTWSFTEILQFF